MNGVTVTIHRAAHEIGGNCIEVAAHGQRILLDAGRPLDASDNEASDLVPSTLDREQQVAGVLLSHPHQDHYGLLGELPASWPVYCGKAAESLIRLTSGIFEKVPPQQFMNWDSNVPFSLGPFRITPFLTDHSAFDAYMLLIEVHGYRLLYSGDFRIHGRKSVLVTQMMSSPPPSIDALIMEGTNLGGNKPCNSEDELEQRYIDLFKSTAGRVFVAWSAQNVDRTVTLFKACAKRGVGRTLVVDLYTAEVMEMLTQFGRLPHPEWGHIKVVVTSSLARMYEKTGRGDFVKRMLRHGISAKALVENPSKWVVMTRKSLIRDYEKSGVVPSPADAWSWSLWRGYLDNGDGVILREWFESRGCPACHIHTSGHASPADLRKFARRINPKVLIPVHGVAWDDERAGFSNILRLADGQPVNLQQYLSAGVVAA
jgi:Predicted hydrolase of the metallo-beta-lactamase superfamily